MSESVVSVENVSLKYKKAVLDNVTISAAKGEVVGLLGLNGSGKSTLLSAVAGLRKPASGTIRVTGKAGFVTQENALIDELTAMDNLKMWTPLSKQEILKELTETELSILKVSDFINLKVKRMSGGMKKRLAIASVLLANPTYFSWMNLWQHWTFPPRTTSSTSSIRLRPRADPYSSPATAKRCSNTARRSICSKKARPYCCLLVRLLRRH